jgi:hypothetical protein
VLNLGGLILRASCTADDTVIGSGASLTLVFRRASTTVTIPFKFFLEASFTQTEFVHHCQVSGIGTAASG